MNRMATVPARAARAGAIRQPRAVHYKIAARRGLLKRIRHFIESTHWEERYLCNRRIDRLCLGGLVVSVIYFAPLLITMIQS